MAQVIFNAVSSAEVSALPKMLQLQLLSEFDQLSPETLESNPDRFWRIEKGERCVYRHRAGEYRIYLEVKDSEVLVHRVLHANTFEDFLYRSNLPVSEEEALANNPSFWEMIDSPGSSSADQDA